MMRIDPGAIGFTSGFSQDSINITVGEQITVEQLIEERIIMTISKAMIMNIGITSVSIRRNDSASTTITPHTSTAIQHASRV